MQTSRQPISFIATDRPDQARDFYSQVLGLTLSEDTPFALVFSDNGHTLRVQIVPTLTPAPFTVYGWLVDDMSHEIQQLTAKGVLFQRFEQLDQDMQAVWTTPDGHKIAWFTDPSGNTLSLTQYVVP